MNMLKMANSTSKSTTKAVASPSKSSGETNSMLAAFNSLKQPEQLIDGLIKDWSDWYGDTIAQAQCLMFTIVSAIFYRWKWSTPVWSCGGINCNGADTKTNKFSATHGVSLPAPVRIFKSSFETSTRRTIDTHPVNDVGAKASGPLLKSTAPLNALWASKAKPTPTKAPAITDQPVSKTKPIFKTAPVSIDQPVPNTKLVVVEAHATTDQPVLKFNSATTNAPAMTDQPLSNAKLNSKIRACHHRSTVLEGQICIQDRACHC